MGQPITVKGFARHSGRIALLLASIVAAASLGIAPVASEPFGSGDVSFVNIDSVEVELVITDNVNKDNEINKKTFHLKRGEETKTFKVSGDSKDGGNSNFRWKATAEDASKTKVAMCKTVKQPRRHDSYGRIDVAAGVSADSIKNKTGDVCKP